MRALLGLDAKGPILVPIRGRLAIVQQRVGRADRRAVGATGRGESRAVSEDWVIIRCHC